MRDLIAVTQENSLELTAGDCAIEIDIDTRKDLRLFRGINQAATLAKFFFRHTACVSFGRNSVLM